ncbi:sigma-70 family RNA polymerase sigma factor [Kribbella sp. NPDC048915]|uniref:RNA polymerase sigma factor n=1 Tax=Kribbella sp. NPDC048915 TaxID=3155148 RepID=UPI0033D889A9
MTEAGDGERPPPEPDAVRLGGVEEFAGLFDTYAAPMHRYLARRVGVDQAHDLVSETFLIAFRRRGTYDPRTAGAKAWLYGIATNLARRHVRQEVRGLRATARAGVREPTDLAAHDGSVAERVDAQNLARRIAPAIADLNDGDRDVLLLTSWAGLTTVEVADALGIPVGTVRSRLHRVRRRLHALTTAEEAYDHD